MDQGNILEEEFCFPDYRQENLQEQSVFGDGLLDCLQDNIDSPPLQACLEDIKDHRSTNTELQELVGMDPNPVSFSASLIEDHEQQLEGTLHLSTTDILRASLKKYGRTSTDGTANGSQYHGFSEEVQEKLQLVELLISAAENVGHRRFDEAHVLLDYCDKLSSNSDNPVERIVFHFSSALRERIYQDAAPSSSKGPMSCFTKWFAVDLDEAVMNFSPPILAIHQKIPFCQVQLFCAMQTIEEHVVTARRIHIIDLAIRSGVHWSTLMQGLSGRQEYPIEHLKITAVGALAKEFLDETGKRLQLFAQELNLSFSFRIVMLSDTKVLRGDIFDVQEDERVIIFANFALRTWIPWPDRFHSLLTAIKKVNPSIMVVSEIESTFASPSLVERLKEALLYFGGLIDSMEDCLGRNNRERTLAEQLFLKKGIGDVVAVEAKEGMDFQDIREKGWRAFIGGLGMVEVDISDACIYQAKLVRSNFECASSCTLQMNGKSLVIGWKGTPLHFFSVWKFSQDY